MYPSRCHWSTDYSWCTHCHAGYAHGSVWRHDFYTLFWIVERRNYNTSIRFCHSSILYPALVFLKCLNSSKRSVCSQIHPSASLLHNFAILMYYSTLRLQNPLRLTYGKFLAQTLVEGQTLKNFHYNGIPDFLEGVKSVEMYPWIIFFQKPERNFKLI